DVAAARADRGAVALVIARWSLGPGAGDINARDRPPEAVPSEDVFSEVRVAHNEVGGAACEGDVATGSADRWLARPLATIQGAQPHGGRSMDSVRHQNGLAGQPIAHEHVARSVDIVRNEVAGDGGKGNVTAGGADGCRRIAPEAR